MAATGYILPAQIDLTALVGADFSTTINLYTDVAQTIAFDLTGYTVSMIVGVPNVLFTLASGSGLSITPASGLIVATMTAAQTATVPIGSAAEFPRAVRYQLKLVDGSSVVSFPIVGNMNFVLP